SPPALAVHALLLALGVLLAAAAYALARAARDLAERRVAVARRMAGIRFGRVLVRVERAVRAGVRLLLLRVDVGGPAVLLAVVRAGPLAVGGLRRVGFQPAPRR